MVWCKKAEEKQRETMRKQAKMSLFSGETAFLSLPKTQETNKEGFGKTNINQQQPTIMNLAFRTTRTTSKTRNKTHIRKTMWKEEIKNEQDQKENNFQKGLAKNKGVRED